MRKCHNPARMATIGANPDPTILKDIPGVTMGKMTLHIDARSRSEAKKLSPLIDFNRSVFLLDEFDKKLAGDS